ncbi:unnamed protein product [Effrenium voratum]|nr:unnamed protein product [Effrenium voratum]
MKAALCVLSAFICVGLPTICLLQGNGISEAVSRYVRVLQLKAQATNPDFLQAIMESRSQQAIKAALSQAPAGATTVQPFRDTTAQPFRETTAQPARVAPSQPRVLIYFVPVPGNSKHPIGYYAQYMKHLCEKIKRAQYNNVGFVGDMSSIVSLAEPCKSLAHGPNIKFSSLAYDDVVSPLPENGTCILKMGWTPLQRAVVKIWLNKVNVLCEAAQEEPDAVTTLIDVNVGDGQLKDAALRSGAKLEPGKLGVFRYKDKGTHGGWFGHPACYGTVKIWAKFMSIRGRDCPRILAPYKEVLAHASDGGCPCFDEEWLMTRLFEKQPDLFCVQGIQGTGYFH